MFRKLQPSRTFALAASGLLILLVATLVVLVVVAVAAASGSSPELLGQALVTLQVLAGCVAAVATGGAGSMAWRDAASKGATSSQAALAADPNRSPVPSGEEGP